MYLDGLWCWWSQWSLATSKTPSTSKPQRSSTSKPNVTPPKPRLQWEKSTTYQRDQNSHTDKSSSYPIEAKINYKKLWFEKIKSKHPHRLRKYEKVETKQPLIHFSSAPQPFFNQMSKATALRLLRDCPSHRDGHEVGKAIKTLWLAAITTKKWKTCGATARHEVRWTSWQITASATIHNSPFTDYNYIFCLMPMVGDSPPWPPDAP